MKKYFSIVLSITALLAFSAVNASAWQITMGDSYDYSGYYAVDMTFEGETTDALTSAFLSVGYDDDTLSFVALQSYDYDDGAFPIASDLWIGEFMPYDAENEEWGLDFGLVYNINGREPMGQDGSFFPVATGQTLLFTIYFEDTIGNADDSDLWFTYGADYTGGLCADQVTLNGVVYSDHALTVTDKAVTVSTVPLPAGIWLLGSGLLAVMGIRRRKA